MRIPARLIVSLICTLFVIASCKKKDSTPTPPTPPPTTTPGCTSNSAPANGAFVANTTTVTLTWTAAATASSYDVYLGTTATPTTVVASNVSTTTYTYTAPATPNVTYYWYVVPKNSGGAATGCTSQVTSFTVINIAAPASFGYYVVGYFPSYRDPSTVPDVKFKMCNAVIYAFFGVNSSGTLTVNSPTTLAAVITKARNNGSKIFVGINDGSGDGKSNFKAMASTAAGRTNFIKDVMAKVRQYNFDGVDVDWEFPSTSDGTDATFTTLMKELSDSLHRDARYYLSAAITAGKYAGGIRDAIRNELFPVVDIFNIMAYDDFSTTVPYKHHSDYALAQTCLNYWLTTRSMPASKAVLGIPAYGRPSGITQSGTILTYNGILGQGGNPAYDSAVVSVSGHPNYTIYYDGTYTTKRKAKLAKDIAAGVMFWEKSQDAMDGNSIIKAACDTVGRAY